MVRSSEEISPGCSAAGSGRLRSSHAIAIEIRWLKRPNGMRRSRPAAAESPRSNQLRLVSVDTEPRLARAGVGVQNNLSFLWYPNPRVHTLISYAAAHGGAGFAATL